MVHVFEVWTTIIYKYVHVCVHGGCMYMYVWYGICTVCTCTCMYVCMVNVCMYVCMVYVCMHVCTCMMDLSDMFSTHGVFVCDRKLVRAWSAISSVWPTKWAVLESVCVSCSYI